MIYGTTDKEIDSLTRYATPKGRTERHMPIPHAVLAGTIRENIEARDWTVKSQGFSVTKDGCGIAGAFDLSIPDLREIEGHAFSLGFIADNACRRSVRIVVGTRVFVCNNGMVFGDEIVLKKRHTKGLDLHGEIDSALELYLIKAAEIEGHINALKEREMGRAESNEVIVRAIENDVLPPSRAGQLAKEWRDPSFPEHRERNAYCLLQAATHIMKKTPANQQMEQMRRFREILTGVN